MVEENWYFHNITEEIIYGDISDSGPLVEMNRRIKKSLVIRKMANDKNIITDTLPRSLGNAIDHYRNI